MKDSVIPSPCSVVRGVNDVYLERDLENDLSVPCELGMVYVWWWDERMDVCMDYVCMDV